MIHEADIIRVMQARPETMAEDQPDPPLTEMLERDIWSAIHAHFLLRGYDETRAVVARCLNDLSGSLRQ